MLADVNDRTAIENWPEPILPDQARVPEIPVTLLPGAFGEMAAAVSVATQTPEALAVMLSMSILGVCAQRGSVAPTGTDYREPLAPWTLTGMESGSRKTAVLSALLAPVLDFEKCERDRLRPEIAKAFAARAVAEKRIEHLRQVAAKSDDLSERQRLEAEIAKEREGMPDEMHPPRLVVNDATTERLQSLMVENAGAIGIMSDEAGILSVLAGLYSGGASVLDVLLQGHSGSAVRVDRQQRSAYIANPRVTIGLAIQPGVLAEACASPKFRHSGLLARFLFALPPSNLGSRDVRRVASISEPVRQAYATAVGALLNYARDAGEKSVLQFNEPGRVLWFDFSENIEYQLGAGSRLSHVTDWAGKLPGQVARIAALLTIAEQGPQARVVSANAVRDAVELGERLITHALAAFRLLGADQQDADAQAVFGWIRSDMRSEFTRHECHRALEGRLRTVDRVKAALARLAELHIIDGGRTRKNPGARPSIVFSTNPKALTSSA